MFEAAAEGWKEYLSQSSGAWSDSDVRHNLGGEVRDRLRQLDLILRHLRAAIHAVAPDPAIIQQKLEWGLANRGRVVSGEITQEEFNRGTLPTALSPAALIDSWDDVAIFTESFYFSSWRMIEVLNGAGSYKFPGLARLKAPAITIVRNHLIQHPEKVKEGQDFTLGLVVMSSGPVLRSLGGVIRGDSGRLDPLPESKDQGLFAAAEELRDELKHRIDDAISRTRKLGHFADITP